MRNIHCEDAESMKGVKGGNSRGVQPSNGAPGPGKASNEDTDADQDSDGRRTRQGTLVLDKLIFQGDAHHNLSNHHLKDSSNQQELASQAVNHYNGHNC